MFSSYVTAPKAVTGGDMSSFLSSFHWMRLQIVSALIGDWVTVTKNDWLRLLPRETFFFFKNVFCQRNNSWQTCLGVPRWPRLYCFAVQVCFAVSRLCFVSIFGWRGCEIGDGSFSCVISSFLVML